jgi:hypothetical protein
MKRFALYFFSLLMAEFVTAEDAGVKRILARYQAIRPAAKDLGMYRLDWADGLVTREDAFNTGILRSDKFSHQ